MSNVKAKIGIVLGVLVFLAPLAGIEVPAYLDIAGAFAAVASAFYHTAPGQNKP